MKPKIVVLMSSYNGEKYIAEQIDSILEQENVSVVLIVRDDGSVDGTRLILKKYNGLPNVKIFEEENIGVVKSFLKLIEMAPDADFYALADQDDIWYKDKLFRACELLGKMDNKKPLLYGANKNLVNANGKFLDIHFDSDMRDLTSIVGVVYLNYIAGCTMVFNKKLLDVLNDEQCSRDIAFYRMHDVWMMFIAHIYGEFIYDSKPVMDYRRHGNNVSEGGVGIKLKGIGLYFNKTFNFIRNKRRKMTPSQTAQRLIDCFSNILTMETREELLLLANYRKNIKAKFGLLLNLKRLNKTPDNNFIYTMKIIFNRL